jgi:hypothetical protein
MQVLFGFGCGGYKVATQADLDVLNAAINKGIRSVAFADGRRIEYSSTADLITAANRVQSELSRTAGTRVRQVRMATSKGLNNVVQSDGFSI